jgi:hypothetical protein
VADEPTEKNRDANQNRPPEAANNADPRSAQRGNIANRLFPGPSRQMSEKQSERVQELLKSYAENGQLDAWREAQQKKRAEGRGRAQPRPAVDGSTSAIPEIAPPTSAAAQQPAATADDVAKVHETLDKQNELLQAILQSSVDTQTDARSTAQNSRTFAWAGTAIALLTLVATVISIVAAVRAG